jgi:hypothetical protein
VRVPLAHGLRGERPALAAVGDPNADDRQLSERARDNMRVSRSGGLRHYPKMAVHGLVGHIAHEWPEGVRNRRRPPFRSWALAAPLLRFACGPKCGPAVLLMIPIGSYCTSSDRP